MREQGDPVTDAIAAVGPGLASLLDEAQAVWSARAQRGGEGAGDDDASRPRRVAGWRAFEDAFPTFYQFTNRPR